ncbi:MAG TPA: glycoside hydrolase domain-containing protein [Bacillus sp. (in: firmicutes)]|nr:glycoside hydrolase domain-containing protein [Bacillus sp. (in: firmicutes)]
MNYYDEKEVCFDYIKTKDELKGYFSQVLYHLVEIGLWDKVRVGSDEPNNFELFKEAVTFIESGIPDYKVRFKCAIHDQQFFEKFGNNIQSISLNTCEVVKNMNDLSEIKQEVQNKNGRMTWFSCCSPEDLNIFINSPLIESRLTGWFKKRETVRDC